MKKKEYVIKEVSRLATVADCYMALVAGEILQFKTEPTMLVSLRDGFQFDEYTGTTRSYNTYYTFASPESWQVVKEKEIHWFDNIPPTGVLCLCEGRFGDKFVANIVEFDESKDYPFIEMNNVHSYNSAKPLTKEELLQFLAFYEN